MQSTASAASENVPAKHGAHDEVTAAEAVDRVNDTNSPAPHTTGSNVGSLVGGIMADRVGSGVEVGTAVGQTDGVTLGVNVGGAEGV